MREALASIIPSLEAGQIDRSKYAATSCETCMHRDKPVTCGPCNICSTIVEGSRSDERYYWEASDRAAVSEIKEHKETNLPDLDQLIQFAPRRCINPSCKHGHPEAYNRGLCVNCYKVLDSLVAQDMDVAEEWSLMYWLCDSEKERKVIEEIYLELYTWDRFIAEGKALPTEEEVKNRGGYPDRELILYYRQTRTNNQRGLDDPTPTEKQGRRVLTKKQYETAQEYLDFREK